MVRASGVSLIELLTVMTIVAILLAVGVPSFRYVTNANRIAAEANGLLGDLQFARVEAIKEGLTVTACISSDGATCSGAASGRWQNGWIVFSDLQNDQTVDAGDTVLRVQKPFTSSDTFTAAGATSAVTFNREGFATGLPNGTQITLHDSTTSSAWTRCLSITLIGLMAVQQYDGSTCT